MTAECHPAVVSLMGGEPLLRPQLAIGLAEILHEIGTQIVMGTGLYFARTPGIPRSIRAAVRAVDLVIVSLDIWHEAEVPRQRALDAISDLRELGCDVAIQLTGRSYEDPYIQDTTQEVRDRFGNDVPLMVSKVSPVGRATGLGLLPDAPIPLRRPEPCSGAYWPVVAFDGAVVACCNQSVVDGERPAELVLGSVESDSWPALVERGLNSTYLDLIRLAGPRFAAKSALGASSDGDYCGTCLALAGRESEERRVSSYVVSPKGRLELALLRTAKAPPPEEGFIPEEYHELLRLGHKPPIAQHTAPEQVPA